MSGAQIEHPPSPFSLFMSSKKTQRHLSPFQRSQPSESAEVESASLYYTCPICSSNVWRSLHVTWQIIKSQINDHLDKCIERQNQKQKTSLSPDQPTAAPAVPSTDASIASSTVPSTVSPTETLQSTQLDPHTPTKKPRERTNNGAEWKPLAERMRPTTFDQMEVPLITSLHLGRSRAVRRTIARPRLVGARPAALRHSLWSSGMWEDHRRNHHLTTNALSFRIPVLLHD